MVLKIFVKIGKDKKPVVAGVFNEYITAASIKIAPPVLGEHIVVYKLIDMSGSEVSGKIDLRVCGYAVHDKGEILERFISMDNI